MCAGPEQYEPGKVSGMKGHVWPEYRVALARRLLPEMRRLFMRKLRTALPDAASHLGLPSFNDSHVEVNLTATLAGGYYRVHKDDSDDPKTMFGYC